MGEPNASKQIIKSTSPISKPSSATFYKILIIPEVATKILYFPFLKSFKISSCFF
jgi:hypothetical protein